MTSYSTSRLTPVVLVKVSKTHRLGGHQPNPDNKQKCGRRQQHWSHWARQ